MCAVWLIRGPFAFLLIETVAVIPNVYSGDTEYNSSNRNTKNYRNNQLLHHNNSNRGVYRIIHKHTTILCTNRKSSF